MKKILVTLFIVVSCKLLIAQVKISTVDDTAVNKPTKIDTKVYRVRNPVDSINPFKRRNPVPGKAAADNTVRTDTAK